MAQDDKPQPANTPPEIPFADRLSDALQDDVMRRRLSVKLTVRGGMPAKRYSFEFAASGDGAASCRFDDRLKNRTADSSARKTAARFGDKEFVALLRKVQPALARPVELPSFLPDTLVGTLEVSYGDSVRRIYFAADPEQAKTQNKVPPPEVRQAVDVVYAAAARLVGSRSMKP